MLLFPSGLPVVMSHAVAFEEPDRQVKSSEDISSVDQAFRDIGLIEVNNGLKPNTGLALFA